MCDPVSLTVAATVATMAGQFVQGQAASNQAHYEQAAADANAKLAGDQARNTIDTTKKEAARRYREASQLEGQQQAALAANGVDINYGSALDVQKDSKMIASEDVGNIYAQGAQKTQGYLIDAYNYRQKAAAAKSAASSAGLATAFGMAGSALGGATQVYKLGHP